MNTTSASPNPQTVQIHPKAKYLPGDFAIGWRFGSDVSYSGRLKDCRRTDASLTVPLNEMVRAFILVLLELHSVYPAFLHPFPHEMHERNTKLMHPKFAPFIKKPRKKLNSQMDFPRYIVKANTEIPKIIDHH